MTNEIYHHGVKGMKWGVRRTPEQLGHIIKSRNVIDDEITEMKKISGFRSKKQEDIMRDFIERDNSRVRKTYDNFLNDDDVYIRKGTKFYRTSSRATDDLNKKLYVSYKPTDNDRYTSLMPVLHRLITGKKTCDMYKNTFVSDIPIVSPSAKKRIDTFINMMKDDSNSLKEFTDYAKRFNDEKDELTTDRVLYELTDPKYSNVAAGRYYLEFQQQYFKDNKINSEYTKRLAKKGYNALVDDNDYDALSKTPLVLFDTSHVRQVLSKKISDKELDDAINRSYKRLK